MTDITELAQREKFEAWFKSSFHPDKTGPYIKDQLYFAWKAAGAEMVEALEKAQTINAAAEKLVRCKGRYHSEQNYRALAVLFGVKTPDLPPLEHENVHYADAAEMEIAALRQRIAELESQLKAAENNEIDARCHIADLESRTVKLPKPHAHLIWIQAGHAPDDYWDDVAVSHSEKDLCCDGSERYPVYARWEIEEMLAAAGIKVEAE
ncbi:ead/Ea22-like family protein [Klebsiella pneumoniae]|uniref:ead/Ea22-like family protein n=1 Tax=Klebsiella pneumoniae TaxID=573 RepID=UPI000342247C|nr:ead/Ea22-like family protein [Klebsiella pneumoniae]HDS7653115.1 ead/Ea22-like family protein [Klebsiella variicola]EOY65748.1 Ead/Ea22-like domain protein [Klebsiella pneumoniae KP-7]EOZ64387.1 Ead/Ea22-like domain protein [Klebsiella pneumoniae KP-11]MBG1843287.1 ead/Ea22-like family protein [Klebsiella pneumoniae]MCZ9584974.1 ead/Ea22-like family protein [Klebsiella pneumoniae]